MKAQSKERELELTYLVTIKTFGKQAESRHRIGHRLSRICGMEFIASEVTNDTGKRRYEYDPKASAGVTPEEPFGE